VITYLVTAEGHATITTFLRTRGRPLAAAVRVLLYEHLPFVRRLPGGTFVFSDVERLTGPAAERATALWNALERAGAPLLNHPTLSMRRFELLRTLHAIGLNEAGVQRVTELRAPGRFPVFLRRENDHAGSLTGLLHTPDALAAEIERLARAGVRRDDLLITELCDTADASGIHRKYSAFRVGDRIVPRHLLFSRDWHVKVVDLHGPSQVAEELEYVRGNPHRDLLLPLFERARIEFGRIDYGMRDGRLQVWEINTNPILGTFEDGGMPARQPVIDAVTPAFDAAFRALDVAGRGPRTIAVGSGEATLEEVRRRLRTVVEVSLRALGLERHEVAVLERLGRLWKRIVAPRGRH
jgi:hypothetical protein